MFCSLNAMFDFQKMLDAAEWSREIFAFDLAELLGFLILHPVAPKFDATLANANASHVAPPLQDLGYPLAFADSAQVAES